MELCPGTYPRTLPDHNVPFAETISAYLNDSSVPVDHVLMVACCWGQEGQPEPDGIRFGLQDPSPFSYIPQKDIAVNAVKLYTQAGSLLLILNPNDLTLQDRLRALYPHAKTETLRAGDYRAAQLMLIDTKPSYQGFQPQ